MTTTHGADLFEDGFPHGTVQGYDDGCRGGACPGHLEYGLSCKRANTLNHSDFRYGKLVAAGKTPTEIAAIIDGTGPLATETAADVSPELDPVPETAADVSPEPDPVPETPAHVSPEPDPVPELAPDVSPEPEAVVDEKPAPIEKPYPHGTKRGYAKGCRRNCPGDPDTGVTCSQAKSIANHEEHLRRKAQRETAAEAARLQADLQSAADIPSETAPDLQLPRGEEPAVVHTTEQGNAYTDILDETRDRIAADGLGADILHDAIWGGLGKQGDYAIWPPDDKLATATPTPEIGEVKEPQPEWGIVTESIDVERARRIAVALEQELAKLEQDHETLQHALATLQHAFTATVTQWGLKDAEVRQLRREKQQLELLLEVEREGAKAMSRARYEFADLRRRQQAERRRFGFMRTH